MGRPVLDGTTWVNVTSQSGEPVAVNAFNSITFGSVTTSKLRISMQSNGTASVGVIQWAVPNSSPVPDRQPI